MTAIIMTFGIDFPSLFHEYVQLLYLCALLPELGK